MWIKAIATRLSQLSKALSPQTDPCPFCGQMGVLNPICPKCSGGLELAKKQEFCRKCGRFITDINYLRTGSGFCGDCDLEQPIFAEARSVVPYNPHAREIIYKLKYTGMQSLADTMGHLMVRKLIASWSPGQVESIVPVPMYEPKLRLRGFNQAEVLARNVALHLQRTVLVEALTRVRATDVQAKLGRTSRQRNLVGAVVPGRQAREVAGKKVVLVDDVLTTGSTAGECTRALLQAGATEVRVLVFAAGIYIERSGAHELKEL